MKSAGLGLLAFGLPPSFLVHAAEGKRGQRGKVLVVVFQRGGMDGLNAVIPFKDRAYYLLRSSIAIPEPSSAEESAVDLDGFYALHPGLAPLKPLFDRGHLAVVHAAGSSDNTRSHFDAQDYMELGTPGAKSTPDGWLNRAVQVSRTDENPFHAVALTQRLPRILSGKASALTMTSIEEFRLRDALSAPALEQLYANVDDPLLRQGGKNLFEAMRILRTLDEPLAPAAAKGYANGRFGASLREISRLIKADLGLEIAFAEIEGWDTHVNQGGAKGQMANRLKELADGLAAFHQDLGDRAEDVVLLTMSEFGRTARENGNRGTDHGHANVMFVMGGKVKGARFTAAGRGWNPSSSTRGAISILPRTSAQSAPRSSHATWGGKICAESFLALLRRPAPWVLSPSPAWETAAKSQPISRP